MDKIDKIENSTKLKKGQNCTKKGQRRKPDELKIGQNWQNQKLDKIDQIKNWTKQKMEQRIQLNKIENQIKLKKIKKLDNIEKVENGRRR